MSFASDYGPWCLILGGSEGIGAAFARSVAARGLNLILAARKAAPLEALAAEIRAAHPSIEVRTLSIDLATDEAAEQIKTATQPFDVGLLIYNAGAETSYGNFLDHEWPHLRGRLLRNFVVKTELTHHFGRAMRKRGNGGIVLLGSISGFFGNPGFALYAASKAFTHSLSEGLWYELKQDNIDVLCPVVGITDTPAMVNNYGPLTGKVSDPTWVAEESLERLKQGPIWVADDIVEQVAAISAIKPVDRAPMAAKMAREFAKRGN